MTKLNTMIQEKSLYSILDNIRELKILLVDDDMASQFIIAKSLENLGDDLDICSAPEDAIERVSQCKYDLILIDMNLPVVNGFELSKSLKLASRIAGCRPVIIGITGLDHPLLETLISYSDIDDYVIRSIDYNDLKKKIVSHCYLHLN
jgi:PleD family two-component response regulator